MTLWRSLYALAVFQATTGATPTVTYPINSQVPPVARISEPFSYTFSTSTFSSYLPITYTLSNAPSWLSLDANSRTLSGTPTSKDVGGDAVTAFRVELTASDSSGSVTLNSTFVISKNPAPVVSIPVALQLPYLGRFSAPSTLLLHQSNPFRLNFQPGTFSKGGSNTALSYYATSTANTPLPSWLTFDAASLSLTGQAPDSPSLIGIQIIASDVEGFSAASISFQLAIGMHTLAFSRPIMAFNAMPGADIVFNGVASNLELDGQSTDVSTLSSITADTPPWLSFNNSTLTISGHIPADATPYNITVHATDIYGDSAFATIVVGIGSSSSFTSTNSPGAAGSALDSSRKHFSKGIIAAIVVPIVLLSLTILVAIFWCRLRRRASSQENRRPFLTDKSRFSESSNAEETAGSPPAVPPKCLRLEALKCVDPGWTSPYMMEYNGEKRVANGKRSMEQYVEGSSASSALVPEPLDLAGYGSRSRSGTENTLHTLHRSKLSWGSTLSSIFPSVRSRANSSSRQTSNYSPCSERGHKRSGRMWSPDQDFRGIHSLRQRAAEAMLNPRDSTISFGAVINFPILSEIVDGQEKAGSELHVENISTLKRMRRRSKSLPTIPPLYSSAMFKRPVSMQALAGGIHDERNAEEGHEWVDRRSMARKSLSWVTVNTKDTKSLRSSSLNLSATAESFYHGETSQGLARLPRSSLIPSASFTGEVNLVEPKSNKRCGSSTFFGPSSAKRSRQLSEQSAASSADFSLNSGLAIPMGPSGVANLNSSEGYNIVPQDSAETSLSSAREGTRQLKDYIQSLLRRTWTQDNVQSTDPYGSPFESARGSLSSMEKFPGVRDSRGSEVKRRIDEQRHESLLPDTASEWSWETHYTEQDDKETVIEDGTNNSPTTEFGTVATGSSDLGSPVRGLGSKDERMYTGSGRRLDANGMNVKSTKKPSRALLDYGEGGLDDITYI